VTERGDVTQVSRIITLKSDSKDISEILGQLHGIIEDVHQKVSEKGLLFRTVSVMGILSNLSLRTKSRTLEVATDDMSLLTRVVNELLEAVVTEHGSLRRVGVRVSDFTKAKEQASLAEFLG